MFGIWPFVVRSIKSLLCVNQSAGFNLEVDRNAVRYSVTLAKDDSLQGYTLFETGVTAGGEGLVVAWLANYWCCMLGEFVSVGVTCACLPSVRGLMEHQDEP